MKIIGFETKAYHFTDKAGRSVESSGYTISLARSAVGESAKGLVAETIYISNEKLSACGYVPKVDDEVIVLYNRFGKVQALQLM